MKNQVSISYMLLGIAFCVCLITSNFLETKVISLGPISGTGGLLIFPLLYIINDCISEVWGFRKAKFIIWIGFLMNFIVMLFAKLAVILPAPDFWEGAEAFNFVFGLAPRIAFASLVAFLVGSFLNAMVMSKMKVLTSGKHFSLRAILSTLAGESADSLVFFPLAFGGLMPIKELLGLMAVQVILKTVYEILILPITISLVKYIKKKEKIDVYDTDVSYNIFKWKN